jgi:hypothetical protein
MLLALAGELGCARKIGDACALSTDCSINGDRLCDTTQPGGYCTIFNCEPDKCPDEAVCMAFTDDACASVQSASSVRFQRTFCMKWCDTDGDCREGYRCSGEDVQAELGARIVDSAPESRQVCLLIPATFAPPPVSTGVCGASDASFAPIEGGAPEAAPLEAGDAPEELGPEGEASPGDAADDADAESSGD